MSEIDGAGRPRRAGGNVNHVVALSGGKDSTALALRLAEMEPREYGAGHGPHVPQPWPRLDAGAAGRTAQVVRSRRHVPRGPNGHVRGGCCVPCVSAVSDQSLWRAGSVEVPRLKWEALHEELAALRARVEALETQAGYWENEATGLTTQRDAALQRLAEAEALLGRWRSNLGQLTATLLHEGREIGAVALQPWFLHVEADTRAFQARGEEAK